MFTFSVRAQDNYEIIKKIGRGKYSEVYEGINTQTNQRIVIKILKPGKFKIKLQLAQFALHFAYNFLTLNSQEEQDSKRDQDLAELERRCEHCRID